MEQNMCKGDCLFHSKSFKDDFQQTLRHLKGKIIPKRIVKRAGYLVCNCTKEHTELDDTFYNIDLRNLNKHISEALNNYDAVRSQPYGKEISPVEKSTNTSTGDDVSTKLHRISDISDAESGERSDTYTSSKCHVVDDRDIDKDSDIEDDCDIESECDKQTSPHLLNKSTQCTQTDFGCDYYHTSSQTSPLEKKSEPCHASLPDHGNLITKTILSCDNCILESDLPGGVRRLIVIVYLCLEKNTSLLEPHRLHKEKVQEFRELNRNVCYRKLTPAEKKKRKQDKYNVVKTLLIDQPVISISGFVGKQGKNIKKITGDKDCRIKIEPGKSSAIEITIHAKTTEDYDVIRKRTNQVYSSLKFAHKQWLLKQHLHYQRMDGTYTAYLAQGGNKTCTGRSQWDLDEEKKASARDEYEKKCSYNNCAKNHSKPKVLEEGSRCLHCLAPYDKTANKPADCIYHPGYLDHNSQWTCCSKYFQTVFPREDQGAHDMEGQQKSHKFNGCTAGRHTWRIHKSKKCSDRKVTINKRFQ